MCYRNIEDYIIELKDIVTIPMRGSQVGVGGGGKKNPVGVDANFSNIFVILLCEFQNKFQVIHL